MAIFHSYVELPGTTYKDLSHQESGQSLGSTWTIDDLAQCRCPWYPTSEWPGNLPSESEQELWISPTKVGMLWHIQYIQSTIVHLDQSERWENPANSMLYHRFSHCRCDLIWAIWTVCQNSDRHVWEEQNPHHEECSTFVEKWGKVSKFDPYPG